MPSILDSLEHTADIPRVIIDNLTNAASAAIEVAKEASKFLRYFSRSLHYDAATTAIWQGQYYSADICEMELGGVSSSV